MTLDSALKDIIETIRQARAERAPLTIRGGGTKDFYGEPAGRPDRAGHSILDMSALSGVLTYHPSELVITVRAGTRLAEIERILEEQGQMLAFEPPRLGRGGTIGGCVAAGLSGPRRMAAGKVGDFVLGSVVLNSSGVPLRFGGEVMKNVAGYDVSRLLAGSMGILGPIAEISLKVLPKPLTEATTQLDVGQDEALALMSRWRGLPLPISATCWESADGGQGRLRVRLSGNESAVRSARKTVGGVEIDAGPAGDYWTSLRDQTHPYFQAASLWRVALPARAADLEAGPTLIEWQGGQRWLSDVPSANALRMRVAELGGHATFYRSSGDARHGAPVFHPLPKVLMALNRRLKQSMDPEGIFNPERLFTGL